jgi:hypothetical protein
MKTFHRLSAATLLVLPAVAMGLSSFSGENDKRIYCDMPEVSGQFGAASARYRAAGSCAMLEVLSAENKSGRSQFDEPTGRALWRVRWTATGGYDPATRDTWETIDVPSPPPGTRHAVWGQFTVRMVCTADPWLHAGAQCAGGQVSTPVGIDPELLKHFRWAARPFTSRPSAQQVESLLAAQRREQTRLSREARIVEKTSQRSSRNEAPRIVAPDHDGVYPAQTAVNIRVAPPKIYTVKNFKPQLYEVQVQRKQADASWVLQTTQGVRADLIEGIGYSGWGAHQPGTGSAMTATPGAFRVRVVIKAPDSLDLGNLALSEWVEFRISGDAAAKADPRFLVAPKAGAAAAATAAPRSLTAPPSVPARSTASVFKADAAALNPQPLPPKSSFIASPPVRAPESIQAPKSF